MRKIVFGIAIIFSSFKCIAQTHTFSVINPLSVQRDDELIILERASIEKHSGKLTKNFHYEIASDNNKINFQTVDINNDDIWDELVFLFSFTPNEQITFTITQNTDQIHISADTLQQLAHVRMKPKNADNSFAASVTYAKMPYKNPPTDFSKEKLPPWLTEGPAWENDKVAFRLYFDTRNTTDIYGKRISGMVMDTVGANPNNSYHNLSAWGMDILRVGKSLGAGSLAIATKDENGKDTLIRLGGENVAIETYQQLADGPLYAAFVMNYQWQINNKPVTIKQQLSIWGRQYFYDSKISISGAPKDAKLITGFADFYENTSANFEVDNAAVLTSHGKQSENKDELGLAIITNKKDFAYFGKAPDNNSDVMNSYYVAQHIINNKPLNFRLYACWEKTDNRFISIEYFQRYMKNEARKFTSPLQIKWP